MRLPILSTLPPANAVQLLTSQIPEFSAIEDDNVQRWIQRIDKVAQIYKISDDVILLAASSKLTKAARQWYNLQTDSVLEL